MTPTTTSTPVYRHDQRNATGQFCPHPHQVAILEAKAQVVHLTYRLHQLKDELRALKQGKAGRGVIRLVGAQVYLTKAQIEAQHAHIWRLTTFDYELEDEFATPDCPF